MSSNGIRSIKSASGSNVPETFSLTIKVDMALSLRIWLGGTVLRRAASWIWDVAMLMRYCMAGKSGPSMVGKVNVADGLPIGSKPAGGPV